MPLPNPKKGEKKEVFLSRCIEDITRHERDKWPNQKQRAAICYTQWREHQKKHGRPQEAGR